MCCAELLQVVEWGRRGVDLRHMVLRLADSPDRAAKVRRVRVSARASLGMPHLRLYRLSTIHDGQYPPCARLPAYALCRLYALRVW
jgi:hypothetical protein